MMNCNDKNTLFYAYHHLTGIISSPGSIPDLLAALPRVFGPLLHTDHKNRPQFEHDSLCKHVHHLFVCTCGVRVCLNTKNNRVNISNSIQWAIEKSMQKRARRKKFKIAWFLREELHKSEADLYPKRGPARETLWHQVSPAWTWDLTCCKPEIQTWISHSF